MRIFRKHGPVLELVIARTGPALVYVSWLTFRFEIGRFLRKLVVKYRWQELDWGVAEFPDEEQ